MTKEEFTEVRFQIETQFRLQLYNDIKFPYLHSLGITHLTQGFKSKDQGHLGFLHFWWVNEDNGITYDKSRHLVKAKGLWKSEWLDTEEEVHKLSLKVIEESPIDGEKLSEVIANKVKEVMSKNLILSLQERIKNIIDTHEDKEEDGVLLN